MTLLERRDLYWQMYFCAEGLKKKAPELINQYNRSATESPLPPGLCYLSFKISGEDLSDFPELLRQEPETHGLFWFKKSDWNIRQIAILEAIKLTYND